MHSILTSAVSKGEFFIEEIIKEKILSHSLIKQKEKSSLEQLTKREKEILRLLVASYSSQEIAKQLFISKRTVENHRANMMLKLNVKNTAALIKKAIESDLLD